MRPHVLSTLIRRFVLVCLAATFAHAASAQQATAAMQSAVFGNVDDARLNAAATEPEQWFTSGRDREGTYFSPLALINERNVQHLGLAWEYGLGTARGIEATPVEMDGTLFAVGNWGRVYALDAVTGRELWTFIPNVTGQWARYACCDVVNRGLAVWRGRVYVGALDGFLYALDARNGHVLWKTDTLPSRKVPLTVTGAPLIAGDVVVIGAGGGDFAGVRGYVAAYSLAKGELKWRFHTVPRDPAMGPQDQPHLVKALETWNPHYQWAYGGGGAVWDGLAYDPSAKLIYIGTDNAAPYDMQRFGSQVGDNLYVASIVAIHSDTGALAWYYQEIPQERWDYGATQKLVLTDLRVAGRSRKVLMQAAKNGFFYVLDRLTGELLSAKPYVFVNWTEGIDTKTGRPIPSQHAEYMHSPALIFPSSAGAHNWQPMSYSAQTRLVYVPALEASMVYIETKDRPAGLVEGSFTVPGIFPEDYDPASMRKLFGVLPPISELASASAGSTRSFGVLRALNPESGKVVWERRGESIWDGGVLSTAGNLVVRGNAAGRMEIFAADTGSPLATLDLGTSIMAAPMTYAIKGKQYLAVAAGYGGGAAAFPPSSAAYKYGNAGKIIVLTLDGKPLAQHEPIADVPFPEPPPREGTPATLARGEILFDRYCSRCHVFGRGVYPDLRRLSQDTHKQFSNIVLKGIYAPLGMAKWDDVLSEEDVAAIHAFIVDRSWAAHKMQ